MLSAARSAREQVRLRFARQQIGEVRESDP